MKSSTFYFKKTIRHNVMFYFIKLGIVRKWARATNFINISSLLSSQSVTI